MAVKLDSEAQMDQGTGRAPVPGAGWQIARMLSVDEKAALLPGAAGGGSRGWPDAAGGLGGETPGKKEAYVGAATYA